MTPHRARRPGWTTPATSCCRARWSGRSPPAPTGSCSSPGRPAPRPPRLLPGVDEVSTWRCPWILGEPPPVDAGDRRRADRAARALGADRGGDLHLVPPVAAARWRCCCGSPACPGSRRSASTTPARCSTSATAVDDDLPEPERALSLARAAGFELPAGDDGRLARAPAAAAASTHEPGYVVVHPGASVPARAWPAERCARGRRGARRRRAPGAGHRRPGGARAHRGRRRRAAASTSAGATDLAELAARARRRRGRRRRQHRPGAPRRRGRHAGRLAVRPGRPGRAVGALRRARPCCSATRPRPAGTPGRASARCPATLPASVTAQPTSSPRSSSSRRGGRRMNVLLWHVHGSWTTAFVQGDHEYLLPGHARRGPDGLGPRPHLGLAGIGPRGDARAAARRATSTSSCCSGPRDLELVREWLGREPGRDLPAVFLEHNTPRRDAGAAHPASAGRPRRHPDRRTSPTSTAVLGQRAGADDASSSTASSTRASAGPASCRAPPSSINEPVRRGRITGTDLLPRLRRGRAGRRLRHGRWPGCTSGTASTRPGDAARRPAAGRDARRARPPPRLRAPGALDLARAVAAGGDAPGHAGGRAGHHRGASRRCRRRPGVLSTRPGAALRGASARFSPTRGRRPAGRQGGPRRGAASGTGSTGSSPTGTRC